MRGLIVTACVIGAGLVGVVAGCGGGSSGGPSGARAGGTTASAAPASAPSAPAAAGVAARIVDPALVPSAPEDKPWYFRGDDPATPENEAAREIGDAIAALGNGLDATFVRDWLIAGGDLAIFVGGTNHERDTPPGRQSGWIEPAAREVHLRLGLPSIQIDYHNWAAISGPASLATYAGSLPEGVLRANAMVDKALAAGAGAVRLYGHSKGGDVVQEICWLRADEPRIAAGFVFGIPWFCAAIPDEDATYGRSGVFKPGPASGTGRDFGGKVVVFIRESDRASHGRLWPPTTFPGPGHDYRAVLGTPGFLEGLERVAASEPVGFEDRPAGRTFDY